ETDCRPPRRERLDCPSAAHGSSAQTRRSPRHCGRQQTTSASPAAAVPSGVCPRTHFRTWSSAGSRTYGEHYLIVSRGFSLGVDVVNALQERTRAGISL